MHSARRTASSHGHRHLVYGLEIESDFPLASVGGASSSSGGLRLRLVPSAELRRRVGAATATDPDDWIEHIVLADGSVYMRLDGIFETIVSADGADVACARLGDADQRTFEANLLNFVLSAALTLRGEEPLHATVLEREGHAFALLGPSGAGKSTLAAFLISRGARLVTDDMLRLTFSGGRALAHHGPHRLKLFDEQARLLLPDSVAAGHFNTLSGKLMVEPRVDPCDRALPRPLAAMFWLGDPSPPADEVRSGRLAGAALARTLLSSAMNIRYHAPDRLARQMRFAGRVAETVPVHALLYPRRHELLGRVDDEIRRVLGMRAPA
jgi:ABC-type uncharacterized transport system YnjBCD ATPase subunit